MKRKGNRDIPDFSKKAPGKPGAVPMKVKSDNPPPPVRTLPKPQATSGKSGQRGR